MSFGNIANRRKIDTAAATGATSNVGYTIANNNSQDVIQELKEVYAYLEDQIRIYKSNEFTTNHHELAELYKAKETTLQAANVAVQPKKSISDQARLQASIQELSTTLNKFSTGAKPSFNPTLGEGATKVLDKAPTLKSFTDKDTAVYVPPKLALYNQAKQVLDDLPKDNKLEDNHVKNLQNNNIYYQGYLEHVKGITDKYKESLPQGIEVPSFVGNLSKTAEEAHKASEYSNAEEASGFTAKIADVRKRVSAITNNPESTPKNTINRNLAQYFSGEEPEAPENYPNFRKEQAKLRAQRKATGEKAPTLPETSEKIVKEQQENEEEEAELTEKLENKKVGSDPELLSPTLSSYSNNNSTFSSYSNNNLTVADHLIHHTAIGANHVAKATKLGLLGALGNLGGPVASLAIAGIDSLIPEGTVGKVGKKVLGLGKSALVGINSGGHALGTGISSALASPFKGITESEEEALEKSDTANEDSKEKTDSREISHWRKKVIEYLEKIYKAQSGGKGISGTDGVSTQEEKKPSGGILGDLLGAGFIESVVGLLSKFALPAIGVVLATALTAYVGKSIVSYFKGETPPTNNKDTTKQSNSTIIDNATGKPYTSQQLEDSKNISGAGGALLGALTGGAAGLVVGGPVGALIGAAGGAVVGGIGGALGANAIVGGSGALANAQEEGRTKFAEDQAIQNMKPHNASDIVDYAQDSLKQVTKADKSALDKIISYQQRQANKKESIVFWMNNGYTRAQAAGLAAREEAESGFNPAASLQDSDKKFHTGILQWSPERRAAILKGTGIDVSTASHADQLKAALWELTTNPEYKEANKALKGSTTPLDAGSIVTSQFIKPYDPDGKEALKTGVSAANIYGQSLGSDLNINPNQDTPTNGVQATPTNPIENIFNKIVTGPDLTTSNTSDIQNNQNTSNTTNTQHNNQNTVQATPTNLTENTSNTITTGLSNTTNTVQAALNNPIENTSNTITTGPDLTTSNTTNTNQNTVQPVSGSPLANLFETIATGPDLTQVKPVVTPRSSIKGQELSAKNVFSAFKPTANDTPIVNTAPATDDSLHGKLVPRNKSGALSSPDDIPMAVDDFQMMLTVFKELL